MTFEELGSGSEFHLVKPTSNGFMIYPANDGEECRQRFHEIVEDAMAISHGYEVRPHKNSTGKGRYDVAEIRIDD